MMRIMLSMVMIVFMAAVAVGENHVSLNESGNAAFDLGNFEEALDFYRQAEMARPETPEIYYNEANTLIETGKYETAVEKLEKVLNSDNMMLQADAYYNGGNGFFKQEDYKQAIEWYQKSLELNPDDLDTKYNLELARNRLKEQMEKQPQDQQQQQDQQEQDQQEQDQQEEQQKEEQQEKDQQEQDQQDQQQEQQQEQQGGKDEEQEEQQQQQAEQNPEEMSKEDALRILNALKDTEEDNQKKQKRFKVKGSYRGNDW